MSTEASEPIYYHSLYKHGVDEKRRVQIPAKWRPAQEDTKLMLMLWRKTGQAEACLLVLPPDLMKGLAKKLSEMPFSDPKAEALRRLLGTNSDSVTLDKGGRICIPEGLATAAGITKDAVLVGMWDRFQIWSPERHAAASVLDEALADEAFGLI
jgi:MraZ protein